MVLPSDAAPPEIEASIAPASIGSPGNAETCDAALDAAIVESIAGVPVRGGACGPAVGGVVVLE